MVQLSEYIDKLLNQGYTPQQIETYLEKKGYTPQQIENAFQNSVNFQEITYDTDKHKHQYLFITIIIVLILLSIMTVLKFTLPQEKNIDISIVPERITYISGSEIVFKLEINSQEESNVNIEYEITDEKGETISEHEERFKVERTLKEEKRIPSPKKEGEYKFSATLKKPNKEKTTSFRFNVKKKRETELTNQTETNNAPVRAQDTNITFERVSNISNIRPNKAINLCLSFQKENKEDCILIVVKKSQKSEFCKYLNNSETRDNCYMNFIVEGQHQLCPKLEMESNINYCNRIRDAKLLAQYS